MSGVLGFLCQTDSGLCQIHQRNVRRGVERVPLATVGGAGGLVAEGAADDIDMIDDADAVEILGPGGVVDGVDGGKGFHPDDESRLFLNLADDGLLGAFAEIEAAAGQGPVSFPAGKFLGKPAEEDPPGIMDERVGRYP